MYRYPIVFLLFACLTTLGCREDRGERLLVINYAPLEFTLQPGITWPQSFAVSLNRVPSRYTDETKGAGLDLTEITAVGGAQARLVSLDGNDFRALSSISLRLCPVGNDPCSEFDEVFFATDLFQRRQTVINLNPTLRNIKSLVESGQFKFELLLTPQQSIPFGVACRLEYSLEVVQ